MNEPEFVEPVQQPGVYEAPEPKPLHERLQETQELVNEKDREEIPDPLVDREALDEG